MFTCLLVRALVLACKPPHTRHFTMSPLLLVPLEHRFHTGRAKQRQKCKLYILVQFACPLLRGPPLQVSGDTNSGAPGRCRSRPSPRSRRLVRGSVCVISPSRPLFIPYPFLSLGGSALFPSSLPGPDGVPRRPPACSTRSAEPFGRSVPRRGSLPPPGQRSPTLPRSAATHG